MKQKHSSNLKLRFLYLLLASFIALGSTGFASITAPPAAQANSALDDDGKKNSSKKKSKKGKKSSKKQDKEKK